MSSNNFNFDQLAAETFQLGEQLESELGVTKLNELRKFGLVGAQGYLGGERNKSLEPSMEIPDGPGLFYWADYGQKTFVLRMGAVKDLKDSMEHLFHEEVALLGELRIKSMEDEKLNFLTYYQTETFELAESIRDQLANRRLLYQEELLCNISDPGFTWWGKVEKNKISLYFRSFGTMDETGILKLGPIGDHKIAKMRFDQVTRIFSRLFPIAEYSCSDKGLVVATEESGNRYFEFLKDLFVRGDFTMSFKDFPQEKNFLTFYLYLKELAGIRNFWIQLEKQFPRP